MRYLNHFVKYILKEKIEIGFKNENIPKKLLAVNFCSDHKRNEKNLNCCHI